MYDTTRRFLSKNKDIVIVGADKSNVSIAMGKEEYYDKMDTHYTDTSTFRRWCSDPTKNMQKKNNNIVRQLYSNKHIDIRTKRQLLTFTAQAPRSHGTLKLHKPNHPMRVITNGINGPSYNMAKLINGICKTAVPSTRFNVRNSFDLIEELKKVTMDDSYLMVSFDVISMFSKIPLELVYKSLRRRWDLISEVTTIPWDTFKEMVKFCLSDTNYVQWNGRTYKQIDGLTIGGCTSSIMADFVMTDLMEEVIRECGYDPILMVKYVDDILAILPKEELENTLGIFNSVHPALKFTYEIEENGSIPYLDIKIIRTSNNTLSTDFYQKPTCSNRLLNYKSCHPIIQKSSMAYGLISRVLTLSSAEYHVKNIMKIHTILAMNGYPERLITSLIQKFKNRQKFRSIQPTVNEDVRYKGMGYVPKLSEGLSRLFSRYDKTLRIGYKPKKKVQTIIGNNRNIKPDMMKHGVVYEIQCNDCEGVYIGQTGQLLTNRVKQHKSDSTEKQIKINTTGAAKHSISTGHTLNFDETRVLDTQQQLSKRLVLEMLYINKNRMKSLNLKSDIDGINPIYVQLLEQHEHQMNVRP